jgi:hypothetical protein
MVKVTVSCLPELKQEQLEAIYRGIFGVLYAKREITGVNEEKDEMILFPPDKWQYGLGQEILAEVERLPVVKVKNAEDERIDLGYAIRAILKNFFPKANVECHVLPPDPKIIVCGEDE